MQNDEENNEGKKKKNERKKERKRNKTEVKWNGNKARHKTDLHTIRTVHDVTYSQSKQPVMH
jgi:hypothetical protein